MAALWPRIGKQHKNTAQGREHGGAQRGLRGQIIAPAREIKKRVRLHKKKILQTGASRLALRTLHSVREQIQSDAKFTRVRGSVGDKKVTMAATQLEHMGTGTMIGTDGEQRKKVSAQRLKALALDRIEYVERHGKSRDARKARSQGQRVPARR